MNGLQKQKNKPSLTIPRQVYNFAPIKKNLYMFVDCGYIFFHLFQHITTLSKNVSVH